MSCQRVLCDKISSIPCTLFRAGNFSACGGNEMFPGDMHSVKSGTIAVAHNEAARRSLADKLAAKYQRENEVFGTAAVTIIHLRIEPPKMTIEQWKEEYETLLPLLDAKTIASLKKEMEPQVVRTSQKMVKPMQCGPVNRLVFRGDTRLPSHIFSTGFSRQDIEAEVVVGTEKTYGGISTSTSKDIVRRKYCNMQEYIYVCWLVSGIDTHDFNKLEEIIALHIEPKHVIAAAGPIYSTSDIEQKGCFKLGVGEIIENLACNVTNTDRDEALRALREICHVRPAFAKTDRGSWET
jgi:hypothetical protein